VYIFNSDDSHLKMTRDDKAITTWLINVFNTVSKDTTLLIGEQHHFLIGKLLIFLGEHVRERVYYITSLQSIQMLLSIFKLRYSLQKQKKQNYQE
jgi:hypothetical protein